MSALEIAMIEEIEMGKETLDTKEVIRLFNKKWARRYRTDYAPQHIVLRFQQVMRECSKRGLLA